MSHLTPVPNDPAQFQAYFEALRNKPVHLPPPPDSPVALTVTVTLLDTEPPVWRRLRLPGDLTLDEVHDVLQEAMGWTDSHLHRFNVGTSPRDPHFVTDFDVLEGDEGTPESEARLDQLLRQSGDAIRYEYDFGDGWEHELRLEAVDPLADDDRPTCLAGARACPPEDCGGSWAHEALVTWHDAGRTAETLPDGFDSIDHALDWLPDGWDPDAFDVRDTDLRLQAQQAAAEVVDRLRPAAVESMTRLGPGAERVASWLGTAAQSSLSDADVEDLTRPWRALLDVLDRPVQLSKAGWLPPEHVARLCDVLEVHPILAGKANRESNIHAVADFRKAAMQVGLLSKSKGALAPTAKGIRLGDDSARLWAHIAERMPVGRSEISQDAGWFTLLALAGGVDHHHVFDEVHRLLVDAGWTTGAGQELARWETPPLVWPTLDCLLGPRRMDLKASPSWLPAAASDVILLRT